MCVCVLYQEYSFSTLWCYQKILDIFYIIQGVINFSTYMYIYMCVCICLYIYLYIQLYIYIYIYIYRENNKAKITEISKESL